MASRLARVGVAVVVVAAGLMVLAVKAGATPTTLYVTANGTDAGDCTNQATPCATVLYAYDQVPASDYGAGDILDIGPGTFQLGYEVPAGSVGTIQGAGAGSTFLTGGSWVMVIDAGADITINDATITGQQGGGIITNQGTVTLARDSLTDGVDSQGGGLYNSGTATLTDDTFVNDQAYSGGAVYNSGTLTLTNDTLQGDKAGAGPVGAPDGTRDCGGAIDNEPQGVVTATDGFINQDSAPNGGGVCNFGSVTLDNVGVGGNLADSDGAGLYNNGATATLVGGSMTGNAAKFGRGGGIFSAGSTLSVSGETIASNFANADGAGIFVGYDVGSVQVTDSVLWDDFTQGGASAASISGGTPALFTDDTITDNHGYVPALNLYDTRLVHDSITGNYIGVSGDPRISGSIIAGNNGSDCSLQGVPGEDNGYNVESDASCGFSAANHSISDGSGAGILANLGSYGGPIQSIPPLEGNPGIGQIPIGAMSVDGKIALCTGTDQRGLARPQGPACSIGATEFDGPAGTINHGYGLRPNQTSVSVSAPGLLAGVTDTNPGSPSMSAVKITDSFHGTTTVNADGSFTYTPNAGFTGDDDFSYQVQDSLGLTSQIHQVFVVVGLNLSNPPTATEGEAYTGQPGLTNQTAPVTWAFTGTLPTGMSFKQGVGGAIVGTPKVGTAGPYSIAVKATDGTGTQVSGTVTLTVAAAPPHAAIIHTVAGSGGGGTKVTITGAALTGAAVSFGGVAATNVAVNASGTKLTAIAPPGAGSVDVTITTPGGNETLPAAYSYLAPVVTKVKPTSGHAVGGALVTISGTSLNDASAVIFGSTPATSVTVVSSKKLTAIAPLGSGTVDVTVTTPGGTSATSSVDAFTYLVPTISTVTPNQGSKFGGSKVTIVGKDFTGATAVAFGSTPATRFIIDSDTKITAVAPFAPVGQVDIAVTNADGTSLATPNDLFTFG
jgi:hypothetical protein